MLGCCIIYVAVLNFHRASARGRKNNTALPVIPMLRDALVLANSTVNEMLPV